ncbi:hypothetical protein [Zavarzinia sp. CC-PAN008]|uniref:hypothetical protein n=1 Tax=Zavarzinia sp. CC-PAN008 TaxID=3243332 RepID=UPI003F746FC5
MNVIRVAWQVRAHALRAFLLAILWMVLAVVLSLALASQPEGEAGQRSVNFTLAASAISAQGAFVALLLPSAYAPGHKAGIGSVHLTLAMILLAAVLAWLALDVENAAQHWLLGTAEADEHDVRHLAEEPLQLLAYFLVISAGHALPFGLTIGPLAILLLRLPGIAPRHVWSAGWPGFLLLKVLVAFVFIQGVAGTLIHGHYARRGMSVPAALGMAEIVVIQLIGLTVVTAAVAVQLRSRTASPQL